MALTPKVALITGSAQRLGAHTARTLHQQGYNLVLHCRHSLAKATALQLSLNQQRADSVALLQADLSDLNALQQFAKDSEACFGQIDLLVNNASSFYPTTVGETTLAQWDDLFGSNAKAPYFLSQALIATLARQKGCIINMVDIHADKPLQQHPVYCMAKAALKMMTLALAKELAPTIRVNGIAPGAILWPEPFTTESLLDEQDKAAVLAQVPLQRLGHPEDIAQAVLFLTEAPYITGHILVVDGGRSLGAASKA